jgi:RHH-type proline utilization regulon transcriptional repressor/proline dehydrogenase/delta 1-pyrroline-5-carboxylate dehydrogenase
LRELVVGDPACVATDVGPLIDAQAHASISRELARLALTARTVARAPLPAGLEGNFFAPAAFEIDGIEALNEEVFGPVLHIVRWSGDPADTIARINALGYGLTLGLQTRIDSRALRLAALARVGNVYVNRNMIGAVVGVQPFGGEGLSGTGPKAGGPHYLLRFCAEQTVTINTAAAGGNAALLSGAAPA